MRRTCWCRKGPVEWTVMDGDACNASYVEGKPYDPEQLRDSHYCTDCMMDWWAHASVPSVHRAEPSHLCANVVPFEEFLQPVIV